MSFLPNKPCRPLKDNEPIPPIVLHPAKQSEVEVQTIIAETPELVVDAPASESAVLQVAFQEQDSSVSNIDVIPEQPKKYMSALDILKLKSQQSST